MKKIRMNCTATLDETFADFLLSRRAKGLAEKTLESYSSQWKAVARHLDTGTDIAALQKEDCGRSSAVPDEVRERAAGRQGEPYGFLSPKVS